MSDLIQLYRNYLVILVWILAMLCTFRSFCQSEADLIEECKVLLANQEYEMVVLKLSEIELSDSLNPPYCYLMASAHFGRGDLLLSEEYWKKLLDDSSYQYHARNSLALISESLLDFESAFGYLTSLVLLKPGNPGLLRRAAHLAEKLGFDSMAVSLYKDALHILPKDIQSIYALGRLYKKMKHYDISLEFVHKALQLKPESAIFKLMEIENLYALGDYDQVIQLIEINEKYFTWNNYLRRIYYISLAQKKRYKEALAVIKDIEEPDENPENTYYYKYKCHQGLGEFTLARMWIEKTIEIGRNPQEAKYYGLLGNVFVDLEMYPQAAKSYQDAYSKSKDSSLLYWIARTLDAASDYERALNYYRWFVSSTQETDNPEWTAFSHERIKKLQEWQNK